MRKTILTALAACGLLAALAGCAVDVEPLGYHGYHHHYGYR